MRKIVFEELMTVLREIESSLNNRPLTFTYEIGEVKKGIRTLKIIQSLVKTLVAQVFSCEFCEIPNNTLLTEHLRKTASIFYKM